MKDTIFDKYKFTKIETISHKYDDIINAIDENYSIYRLGIYESNLSKGIFIHAKVVISLPTNGVYDQLDIKEEEDILIYLKENYPYFAPSILFVRLHFSTEKIPHLNYGIPGTEIKMLNPCLFRGDINEWYYQNGPKKFCDRINEWFSDLVNGELMKDDGFETLRTENVNAILEIDYDYLDKYISNYKRGYGVSIFQMIKIRSKYFKMLNLEYSKNNDTNIIPCLFLFDREEVVDSYVNYQFEKVSDLRKFPCGRLINFGIRKIRGKYFDSKKQNKLKNIVLILAVHRPMQVIGSFSNYEYIAVLMTYDANREDIDNFSIEKLAVIQSINKKTMERLSKTQKIEKKPVVLFGCGALGSKISLHLARMGYTRQHLYDNDIFLPHNLVRHSQSSNYLIGASKSKVMESVINNFSLLNESKGYEMDIFDLKEIPEGILIDCTASKRILYWSISSKVIKNSMIRTEIYLDGKMGLTLIEGNQRNPDVLDMMIELYAKALENETICHWLNYESVEDVIYHIGFGCSSDTMVLDDATISNHASIIPGLINKMRYLEAGMACINIFDVDNFENNKTIFHKLESMEIFEIGKGWSVHIQKSIYEKIKNYANEQLENAGLWIGRIDNKINRITIVDTFIPVDNIRCKNNVVMGKEKVNLYLEEISKKTNNLIGYIGEWHTHISNSASPSKQDLGVFNEMKQKKCDFLMTIVSTTEINNFFMKGESNE